MAATGPSASPFGIRTSRAPVPVSVASVTLPDRDVAADAAEATLTGTGALEVLIPKGDADGPVAAADPVAADEEAAAG